MAATNDQYIYNPAAYGGIPNIPPTSTNTSTSTSTWTPNLTNYELLSGQASNIASNQMAGHLNPWDLANAQEWAAQRGVITGTGFDSPNNMAAYQHFLGLSAQQLEQQGLTNYNALLAGAPRTTDVSGTQTIDNNVLKAITDAAPDPYAAAMANLAAQRAGLAGGSGAVGGGGTSQSPFSPAMQAALAAQSAQAAARAGGGGAAGGPYSDVLYSGTGAGQPPPYQAPIDPKTGNYYPLTGNMVGGGPVTPQSAPPGYGSVIDDQGNEWLALGNGEYMNLSTLEIQQGTPGASSIFGGVETGGGGTYDPFNPFAGTAASLGAYGGIKDYSQPGYDPMASSLGLGGTPFYGNISDDPAAGMMGGSSINLDDWLASWGIEEESPGYGEQGSNYDYTGDYAYPPEQSYDYTGDYAYPVESGGDAMDDSSPWWWGD